ncbi:MAG: M28 family peptidase, partial [Thermomicrobiaceae bacterium]|nr:M28 family peptidase [Thermomicrobiaceae bacterium]
DYESRDAQGRIVLAELSYAPPRPEKARIAAAHGAVGLVLMNWGDDDNPSLPMGTVKSLWGNPTVDDLDRLPAIPAVGIARPDGVWLRDMLLGGTPVRARLVADASREWRLLHQPRGALGAGAGREWVLVADHLDSWGGGATDNATGNAVTLEVARVLAERRDELRRDVQVAFWQAHEDGIMEGSTWFVDHEWDAIDRGLVGYLNIDSPGMRGAERYEAALSPELWTWHRALMPAALGYVTEPHRLAHTGDQSFFGVGVPAISGRSAFPPALVERWHGAVLGPWYQSGDDTLAVADRRVLAQDLAMALAYAWDLATRPVLPYDFRVAARVLRETLEGYRATADDTLRLGETVALARELEDLAARVYDRATRLAARFTPREWSSDLDAEAGWLNGGLMRLSRALT